MEGFAALLQLRGEAGLQQSQAKAWPSMTLGPITHLRDSHQKNADRGKEQQGFRPLRSDKPSF